MVSVILPTLNEQEHIQNCLASVYTGMPHEVIVVDGGSDDATGYLAKKCGARVVASRRGLAAQCNAGADAAGGDVLLFLAADTTIDPGYVEAAESILGDRAVAVGGFTLSIEDPAPAFRAVEWGGNFRGQWFGFTLPDQGLFVRKGDYERVRGMDRCSLIPFANLCDGLKKRGVFRRSPLKVKSSSRKWKKHGIVKTCLAHNWTFLRQRGEPTT